MHTHVIHGMVHKELVTQVVSLEELIGRGEIQVVWQSFVLFLLS